MWQAIKNLFKPAEGPHGKTCGECCYLGAVPLGGSETALVCYEHNQLVTSKSPACPQWEGK